MDQAIATARRFLLRQPARINVRTAAISLIQKRQKCSENSAKFDLEQFRSCNVIEEMFRAVMPEEYAAQIGQSRVTLPRRFFNALQFPVNDFWIEQCLDTGDDPLDLSVPIVALNPHVCEECHDFTDNAFMFQIVLLFYGGLHNDPEYLQPWRVVADRLNLPDRLQPTGRIDTDILETLFAKQRSPLKYFATAMHVAEYRTGSIFYDFNENDGDPDITWNPEAVDYLQKDYKAALKIDAELGKLNAWLNTKTRERTAQALRIYQKAQKLTDAKTKKTSRRHADQGRALVRVL